MAKPGYQNCTIFCFRTADSTDTPPAPNYLLSVFQEGFIGNVNTRPYDKSDLTNALGMFEVNQQNQDLILAITVNQTYVLSDHDIADGYAVNWVALHDGDQPDEQNQIQFTKIAGNAKVIKTVSIILNSRVRGRAEWAGLKTCLASNPLFTAAQLDAAEAALISSGVADVTPSPGSEDSILVCIHKNRPSA